MLKKDENIEIKKENTEKEEKLVSKPLEIKKTSKKTSTKKAAKKVSAKKAAKKVSAKKMVKKVSAKKKTSKKHSKEKIVKDPIVKKLTEKLVSQCIKENEKVLLRTVPNLMQVVQEKTNVVLLFNGKPPQEKPYLKCEGLTIPVKMMESVPKAVVSFKDKEEKLNPQVTEIVRNNNRFHKDFSDKIGEFYNIKEAIGPGSISDNNSKQYQEWKKRHKKIIGIPEND